ncbi:FAD-binding protein [Planctomycetota bacterium]
MERVDVAIIGAGPAGLATALGARRAGARKVTVFELQREPGLVRRGEIVRADARLVTALSEGIYERHSVNVITAYRYFSASGRRFYDRSNFKPPQVITFTPFVQEVAELARKEGVRLVTGAQVLGLRTEKGVCRGLRVRTDGTAVEVEAHTVIGAGGTHCPSTSHSSVDRRAIDCPILKMEYAGLDLENEARLEFHVDARPGVPPAAGFIFPRGGGAAEVGYVVFADCMRRRLPAAGPALDGLYESFLARHARFANALAGAGRTLRTYHHIPMGGYAADETPTPGLLTVGDRTSHITAGGGSGVNASLRMGLLIGGLAGELAAAGTAWTPGVAASVSKTIRANGLRRQLRLEFGLVRPFRKLVFNLLGDPRAIDNAWPFISLCLRFL